ncbi:transporter, SSS family [Mariniphaga anaerophila]|uniref:Transporter, SSS family n=1 Tax=Mariniphaga anaerophila TaxID=1484053 RepID=A0A1M5GJ43_9BACT|nr:sodium:solute symporter [Mariniphaga anaerophila]SHG03696.1 transporter, SSS family [Mariniphaga anaerophila]
MNFTFIDIIIIIAYLGGITWFGIKVAGKQVSTKDYFLGGQKIPWWVVCFSIVATETSSLTFISIPGLAYLTNLNFLQITLGYFLGRVVVAWVILPSYFKGELGTAYTFLANRFGIPMKNLASGVFMLTRLAADGVRLFATAIPLALILKQTFIAESLTNEWIYIISIILIALVTYSYTFAGGLKSVVWMEVVQLFIYFIGAIAAIIVVNRYLSGGIGGGMAEAFKAGKYEVFNFSVDGGFKGFISTPYTFIASILGGAFLSMASHGIDQLVIQRLLATGTLKASRKALVITGGIIIFQFALFLFLGSLLFVFYGGADIKPDEVFPRFIIEEMPTGLSGLIIAALFAAAMSTLSSSITALGSTTMYDYVVPYYKRLNKANEIIISRLITGIWCFLLIGSAILFMQSSQVVVELALSIASFTYGGLLGTFFLGVLFRKPQIKHATPAFMTGIIVMIYIILFTSVAWTWYTLIGTMVTVITGLLLTKTWRTR